MEVIDSQRVEGYFTDMRRILYTFLTLCLAPIPTGAIWAAAQPSSEAIQGFWYTEGREGGVELYACGDQICGRLYWLNRNSNNDITQDINNPDPSKRSQSLCHLQFMGGFTPDGDGHYTNGWVYSPRHGETFSAHMELLDHDTLNMRGYIFAPILGENQTWKRADTMPSCRDNQADGNSGLKSRG